MGWLQIVMVLYGLFNIAMGVLGMEKGSYASLAAGSIAGLLVIGCAVLTKTNPRVGFITAAVIGLLVGGRFAPKAFQGQLYPGWVIFGVSIVFVAVLLGAHFAAVKKRRA